MGRIIVGFPGVGKSSLKEMGWIDLRSDCFWIGDEDKKIRPEGWYESFCNVAIDLSNQGYDVLVPSHEAIRRYLKFHNQAYTVIYPDPCLKEKWTEKLKDRYEINPNRETLSAYEAVRDHWDDFMKDLSEEESSLVIKDMDYSLRDLITDGYEYIKIRKQCISDHVVDFDSVLLDDGGIIEI